MKTGLLIAALGSLLAAAALWAGHFWAQFGEVQFSGHGVVALILGIVLSLALGIGLMFLVFYSNRRGHDDGVGR